MASRGHLLTVLEGKWFKDNNVSVRDMLRPLMEMGTRGKRRQGDAAIHYEMITKGSFRPALQHAFGHSRPKFIYVAAHGDKNGIRDYHGGFLSRDKIRDSIPQDKDAPKTRFGIFFSACQFGYQENAEHILNSRRVLWFAGYENDIDWYDAALLDAFFLGNLLFPRANWRHYTKPKSHLDTVRFAASRVKDMMPDLAQELGFCVMVRKKSGGRVNLMDSTVTDGE